MNGLATLNNCDKSTTDTPTSLRSDGDIVKSVTLAGAFVPVTWATGGKILTMDEVKDFYTSKDFRQMVDLGVNTVQIPVPCDAFYDRKSKVVDTVSHLLERADKAGLSAIIVLVMADDKEDENITAEMIDKHISLAAKFASDTSNVIALQLPTPSPSLLSAVRSVSRTLAVLVPTNVGQINNLSFPPDSNIFAALDVGATTGVANVASSDSESDRMKMFYRELLHRVIDEPSGIVHFLTLFILFTFTSSLSIDESITCINRSPIEWLDCYRDMPVYVTSGFDLAIDDCVNQDDKDFKDYGQCDRFDETIASGWWERHRSSLASRQLFTYSKGLGWSFSAWKLWEEDTDGLENSVMNTPAKLLCLRDVAEAGLIELSSMSNSSELGMACLNGPQADFVMGDNTYAPTPGPHDCGNGWWNDTTLQCDYWIPPPPAPKPTDYPALLKGAAGGAAVALLASWLVKKMSGRNAGYQTLP